MPPKRPGTALRRRDTGVVNSAKDIDGNNEEVNNNTSDTQQAANALAAETVTTPPLYTPGDYIECRLPQWSDYFKGYINQVGENNTYTVNFDDGERVTGISENLLRKVIIVDFVENEMIEAKCEGWVKYYKGQVIEKVDKMHYHLKFLDGEIKKNIPCTRMRKVTKTSPPPQPKKNVTPGRRPRPASASRASPSKRGALTFAAWKRGGANSLYGHGSGSKYRPSTVPLNGTSKKYNSPSGRREYQPSNSRNNGVGGRQRPSSAAVRRGGGAGTPSYYQNLKNRPQSAGMLRSQGRPNTNFSTGSPLPIRQQLPNTRNAVTSMHSYNAQAVDPFMKKLMAAIYLDKPGDVPEYVLDFTQNYLKNRPNITEGATVLAKCTGWTKYYSGEVIKVNVNGTYDIKFEDGERKVGVKESQIKEDNGGGDGEVEGENHHHKHHHHHKRKHHHHHHHKHHHKHKHHHHHKLGDRVEAKLDGWTKYYAGEIIRVNNDETFDLKFDDGELKSRVKKSQLKRKHHHHHKHHRHGDDQAENSQVKKKPATPYDVNERVEAKCTGWVKAYAGTITNVNDDGTFDIKFDDGETKKGVKLDEIKGKATPAFGVNDRIEAKCSGWTKFFAGTVTRVNDDGTYDIHFDDGEKKRGVTENGKTGKVRKLLENTDNNEIFKYKVGERVLAKCTGWTKYFEGAVIKDNEDDTYGIQFDDGEKKKYVKAKEMRKLENQAEASSSSATIPDAIEQETVKRKKYKMVHKVDDKVEAKATGWKEWYAGVITNVDDSEGLYTIKFEADGEVNNTIQEFQIRKILTETYNVGDVVDVKMNGWKQLYRGEVVLINKNRTYNIQFEDELRRGVKTIEIRGLAANSEIVTCSDATMELVNTWSKDEGKVGKFISAVIDMVGDEDYLPKFVFQKSLKEDAEFQCTDQELEEICARFADAKGDRVNCVDFVEYVQTIGQGLPEIK